MPSVNLSIADPYLLSESDAEELRERVNFRKFDLLKKIFTSKKS